MNLIILWKENINNQLSIIDFKDRLEDSFFEERWLKSLRHKINEKDLINKKDLLYYLDELDLIKKAFKNSLVDFKNDTNDILKKSWSDIADFETPTNGLIFDVGTNNWTNKTTSQHINRRI